MPASARSTQSAALKMPGVHAVLTADDLPARMATAVIPMLVPNPSIKSTSTQLALARDEVCYVGQTVAVVIADSRYLAEDAAAAVNVDYELLPAVSDCREAVKPGAPRVHSGIATNVAAVRAHEPMATSMRPSRTPRMCSRTRCSCIAAAP